VADALVAPAGLLLGVPTTLLQEELSQSASIRPPLQHPPPLAIRHGAPVVMVQSLTLFSAGQWAVTSVVVRVLPSVSEAQWAVPMDWMLPLVLPASAEEQHVPREHLVSNSTKAAALVSTEEQHVPQEHLVSNSTKAAALVGDVVVRAVTPACSAPPAVV